MKPDATGGADPAAHPEMAQPPASFLAARRMLAPQVKWS